MSAVIGGGKRVWVAFVVLYGVAGGGFNALFPTMVGEVFGMRRYGAVNGFMYFMRGVGAVVGSPVGGSILGGGGDGKGGVQGWRGVVWFDGGLLVGACVCVGVVRVVSQREGWRWKA
jgi:MFS family permease